MRASIYLSLLRVAGCADRGTVTVPVTVVAGTSSSETAAQDTPTAKPTSTPKERADKPKAPLGEDITAAYIAMHDGTYAAPPTEFRSGHVSPKGFAGEHVTATDNGFRIRFPSKAPIVTPAVYDTKVVVSGGFRSKEMYAFDARTGAPAWGAALDDDGPSAPACAEGLCAFNTESCTLFVVDAATGKMRWSKWLGDPLASAPTVANGRVCTSYPAGDVRGGGDYNPGQSSVPVMKRPSPNVLPLPVSPRVAPTAGRKVPTGMTHAIAAFDLKTGEILWQRWLDSEVMSAPVAEGGDLYLTTFAGTYLRLKQSDGTVKLARKVRATSPPTVLAGGDVIFSQRVDTKDGKAGEAVARLGKQGFDPTLRK